MPFVTIRKAATLDELAGQLFEAKKGTPAAKQAEAALLQANPHIADLKTIPAGTVILVPEKEGLKPRARAEAPGESPLTLGDRFTQLSGVLRLMGKNLAAAHVKEADDAKATIARAKSKEFTKLVDSEELKATVAETLKNAQARAKALDAARGTIETTVKRAAADLEALQRRFDASPTGRKPESEPPRSRGS